MAKKKTRKEQAAVKAKAVKPLPKKELVKEFTIRRRDWGRGGMGSSLFEKYRDKVQKCCIGFYAQACGMKSTDLKGRATVDELVTLASDAHYFTKPEEPLPLRIRRILESVGVDEDTEGAFFLPLYGINDEADTDDAFKEAAIIKAFAKKKIKVTFVD